MSGGSSSGTIEYPAHMQTPHADWIDNTGADTMVNSIVDLMNAAQAGVSPYAGFTTADPDTVFGIGAQVLTPFQALEDLDDLNLQNIFDAMVVVVNDNAEIVAIVNAETAILANRLVTDVLPRFQGGMRDIGAVQVTSFVLGQANIEAEGTRKIAEFDARLRLESRMKSFDIALQWTQLTIEWNRNIAGMLSEIVVRYLEARYKGDQMEAEMDAKDALFDLETYQYGNNVMAAISGATAGKQTQTSGIASALGGVASGAAAGAQIGSLVPGVGTAAGAGIGALLGLADSFF